MLRQKKREKACITKPIKPSTWSYKYTLQVTWSFSDQWNRLYEAIDVQKYKPFLLLDLEYYLSKPLSSYLCSNDYKRVIKIIKDRMKMRGNVIHFFLLSTVP